MLTRKEPAVKKQQIKYPTTPYNLGCPDLMRRIQKERDRQAEEYGKSKFLSWLFGRRLKAILRVCAD
jgi:hypothetical protein